MSGGGPGSSLADQLRASRQGREVSNAPEGQSDLSLRFLPVAAFALQKPAIARSGGIS